MKQVYAIWLLPVSISVILHLVVILFYLPQAPRPASARLNTLLVEMQTISAKPVVPPTSKLQPKPEPKLEPVKQPVLEPTPVPQAVTIPLPSPEPATIMKPVEMAVTANTSSQPDIQPLSKLTRPPAFLRKIDPVYPASEQRSGSQAYVLAEITLDAEGKLLDVKILKSAGKQFDEAVQQAIRSSEFQPGYIESKPVAVRVQIPFRFKLK